MRIRIVPVMAAVAVAFLLAGCTGAASEQAADLPGSVSNDMVQSGPAPEVAPMEGGFASDGKVSGSFTTQEPSVIRTAFVNIRVEDVGSATADIRNLVTRRNGVISAEDSQVSGDSTYSSMTVQVPAAQLDAFVAAVSSLGEVDSVSANAQDVTTQVVDLDARIKALQTSIDRMNQLLSQAEQIDDLLAIETQLSTRQAELDSLTAQRNFLGDQVAMSSVTITMAPMSTVPEIDAPGFLSGLRSGWAAFASAIAVGVTAIGFLLPFTLILLLVAVPLIVIAVRQSRRRVQSVPAPQQAPLEHVGSSPSGE